MYLLHGIHCRGLCSAEAGLQGERLMAFGGEQEGEGEGADGARVVLSEAAVLDTED